MPGADKGPIDGSAANADSRLEALPFSSRPGPPRAFSPQPSALSPQPSALSPQPPADMKPAHLSTPPAARIGRPEFDDSLGLLAKRKLSLRARPQPAPKQKPDLPQPLGRLPLRPTLPRPLARAAAAAADRQLTSRRPSIWLLLNGPQDGTRSAGCEPPDRPPVRPHFWHALAGPTCPIWTKRPLPGGTARGARPKCRCGRRRSAPAARVST